MKGKTKAQKGITLIALIITIVVLLILAAVAIASIQNDGILAYASNAASAYNKAQGNEAETLGNYLEYLNKNIPSTDVEEPEEQGYRIGFTFGSGWGDYDDVEIIFSTDNGATWTNTKDVIPSGNGILENITQIWFKVESIDSVSGYTIDDFQFVEYSNMSQKIDIDFVSNKDTGNITVTKDMRFEVSLGWFDPNGWT